MNTPYIPRQPLQIRYCECDFAEISEFPVRINLGIYITIISGKAILNTGAESYNLMPQMELSFIHGGIFQCSERTNDFKVRIFTYTSELFAKIALPIDNIYFEYNEEHPTYVHTEDKRSQKTWKEAILWMDTAKMLFAANCALRFPRLQEETFLQAFWLWNFGTIQDRIETHKGFANTQYLAHKFIRIVKSDAKTHHQVAYYADKLNISQRYLNKVVWRHSSGRTPKQIIDAHLIAEIKELLMDASLSVTQIAEILHFPDQSYLSRFFRRHTGQSPIQYRSNRALFWNSFE